MIILASLFVIILIFQYKPVQTWAAKKATRYLSKELKTEVSIRSLYIKPFASVVLEEFYVLDREKDTLLHVPKLTVALSNFSPFSSIKKRQIDFTSVQLDNGAAYVKTLKDSTTNLKFIIDYFDSKDTLVKPVRPWALNFDKITVNNMRFRYKNFLRDTLISNRINYDDIDIRQFSVVLRKLDLKNHLFKALISDLTLREKSGFYVKQFNANATVDTNQIQLKNLFILTPQSKLKDYFQMKFKSFDDFNDFENNVAMDADFKQSRISSHDITYFTSGLQKVKFNLGIDGRITGLLNNLNANNLAIMAGQATYLKGDFNMKGLPDWDQTFMELKFEQIATNKKDIDRILGDFTAQTTKAPDIISQFGNIYFNGRFTGFQNDFIAYGEFKTGLGRFDSDVNMKISKSGTPSYGGKINTYDFDLGQLLSEKSLGRTSLSADIQGKGFDLKSLAGKVTADAKYFDFNQYRYSNIKIDGSFSKKYFDGKVLVEDKNLNLVFDGNVNLNPGLPVFNFTSTIKNARLNELNLLKDTISIDAKLHTNFSGNNLNNINGKLLLQEIRLVNPTNHYVVDSVYFAAAGQGKDRQLTLKSDIADGSLKGDYDLNTLPSYFKTLIKQYVPSLKTTTVTPKPQNFEFNLQLKNLDPVTALFIPELKIPESGSFVGKFNSATNTATLNGLIKTIRYQKFVLHDLLIDEGTYKEFMNLNISLSKIDLTDSLYIKNISITNFLKKDSLNFNVKLSDKNATNQLDLYGLVEFGQDTSASLKIMPSDVILQNEAWKITDQVRIRFKDGDKTQVSGFELSNGLQKVSVDGVISADPADILEIGFEKFNLHTLEALTRPTGIDLGGMLNGSFKLNSVTRKAPGVEAAIKIDTLKINETLVGDLKFTAQLDNENKHANIKLNILNQELETLNVNGSYDMASADNNLDFNVKLDKTEAIILEPLVNKLVSNLNGKLSADMRLTGTLAKPKFDGTINLLNTGLTVNYLKTPYIINKKLAVNNNIIDVENMILKDNHSGEATANGKVDLNDLNDPYIDVRISAKNFLALNTTFKDNRLYYGTAYATGNFSFVGPTQNIRIDISAKTDEGTVFNIPLNTANTANDYDFITFIGKDSANAIRKERSFKGVTLNFDLNIDEKTLVKITTDYGQLEGSGEANNLKLNINSLGDFEMFGDYLISSGKFEFTAQNFISKNFSVNEGGTIRWTGSPSNAEINLKATYEVRTSIQPLYQAAGLQASQGAQQKLVQAQLILTKSLLQPTIDFDFNFPTDPSIKDEVATYLNDVNNRNQQALSLIVRRNFAPGTGTRIGDEVLTTAQQAVSEFAFNKINNFISQSNIKNLDLNIRSISEASASFRLFKDRLVLNGSLYNNRGSSDLFAGADNTLFNSDFNNLTKDFEAQYLIQKDGKLTARYSYRVLNNNVVSTLNDQLGIQYINGLGLVYRQDFDSFSEFLKNIFGRKRPKKNTGDRNNKPSVLLNEIKEEEN
ncbi:MAG: translocation/assembly module TamB domain-containing protein [Sphingobacteriaceae bacterium]